MSDNDQKKNPRAWSENINEIPSGAYIDVRQDTGQEYRAMRVGKLLLDVETGDEVHFIEAWRRVK